jgi:hypothetical protein
MSEVMIVSFVNQFVDPPRLETLVDWTDEWHADDPFAGATFQLAHTAAADPPQPPAVQAYALELEPYVIEEVREQLAVVGSGQAGGGRQLSGIARLAPDYVLRTARAIGGPLDVGGAMGARAMADLTAAKPRLFSSPNVLADLERWTRESFPQPRAAQQNLLAAPPSAANPVRDALDSVLRAASGGHAAQPLAQMALAPNQSGLESVARSPRALRAAVAAAAASSDGREAVAKLERSIRARAVSEQLAYAEALRRDQVFSRLRGEEKPKQVAAMTDADDRIKKRHRRADIRRVARDEPVIGAIFHVLRWFKLPAEAGSWDGRDLWVLPFRGGIPVPGFKPVATRTLRTPHRLVTVLRRDAQPTYFAQHVTVRQIAPALLLEDPPAEGVEPAVDQLERMLATGQTCPPFRHSQVSPEDPAFALNTEAHKPVGKASEYIFADAARELADAAESVRRNAPPHDTIGITWERTLTAGVINGEHQTPYFTGFKGYRIDAREVGGAAWQSLCTVEREVFDERGEAVLRTRGPRESYVIQPVQNHSPDQDAKPTVLTMPSDFVEWAGGSTVVAAPFDRLGESLAPSAGDGSLISLREIGTTAIHPRYGRTYEFRVRGVGITGTGPDARDDPEEGERDAVVFMRGVPMDAPPARARYFDLFPLDHAGRPVKPQDHELTPDVPLLATSRNARLEIDTALPLAHWRVALHARGLRRDEQAVDRAALEAACARFVRRSRDNWRRRIGKLPPAETLKSAAFLSAVDPHCGAVELVTRAWFPFSTNRGGDRYIVTGREIHPRTDVRDATFSRLVTMGEDSIETDSFDDTFVVELAADTLPSAGGEGAPPRILAGFHCSAEVAARWSDDAVRHYPNDLGRRRWTRHVLAGVDKGRPVGGAIATGLPDFLAGSAPLVTRSALVDAAYSAIADLEHERNLVMPRAPQTTAVTCEISEAPPAHAEAVRWRKIFFDRDCATQPASGDCHAKRAVYRAFVRQQLGASVELSTLEGPGGGHRNQLAVRLEPLLVGRERQALVLPIFTFPGVPSYEQTTPSPKTDEPHSVIVTFGEFGAAGVKEIHLDDGGTGYADGETPEVTFAGGQGSGARALAKVENGAVTSILVGDGGRDYEAMPAITIAPPKASGGRAAKATVTGLAPTVGRKLPWVDYDVVWTVRLAWCVPLAGSGIERPLELAAVREFQLFRCDKRPDANNVGGGGPVAVLTRPGFDLLQEVDLDKIEFTWVDAITDRDRHELEYRVVAVPEDRHTFEQQVWYTFKVNVPDSRIAARPESAHFLPMLAAREEDETTRSLAIYFSDAAVRRDADHLTYFFARAADDPLLAIEPHVRVAGSRALFEPVAWPDLFPGARVAVTPVADWSELRRQRTGRDGVVAPLGDCSPASADRRGRVFVVRSRIAKERLIAPAAGELGNPFFKLHLHVYDEKRFPALAHTAASEAAESDWLQFYPDDLRWSCDESELAIASPWGRPDPTSNNHVWYRFHFFAPATDTLTFHVSTFYSQSPQLYLDTARRAAILASFRRFAGGAATTARLLVRAEEGILAETYQIAEKGGKLVAEDDPARRFVVLRSTLEPREVRIGE